MTDKELLEWAAKAGEIIGAYYKGIFNDDYVEGILTVDKDGNDYCWNSLQDDGDALRLAVKLGMVLELNIDEGWVHAYKHTTKASSEPTGDDPYTATRRAITRAAAQIGRAS